MGNINVLVEQELADMLGGAFSGAKKLVGGGVADNVGAGAGKPMPPGSSNGVRDAALNAIKQKMGIKPLSPQTLANPQKNDPFKFK